MRVARRRRTNSGDSYWAADATVARNRIGTTAPVECLVTVTATATASQLRILERENVDEDDENWRERA